jgi:hypothetical protein
LIKSWQFIDIASGDVALYYQLPNNINRKVAFDQDQGSPE